jgi:hypothetical protein
MQASTMTLRIIISGMLIVLLFVTGIFLTRTGKPYHVLVLAIHKIVTVALIVLMFMLIVPAIMQAVIPIVHLVVAAFLALGLIGMIASGGMMSLDKYQGVMLWIHRVSVAVFLLCFLDLMYVLLSHYAK